MAKILLLGTWLAQPAPEKDDINRRNEGRLSFGGMSGQLEITGPRIQIERRWIANDRTWKHGMPRSVVEGQVDQLTDDLFVVVDEPQRREHWMEGGAARRRE